MRNAFNFCEYRGSDFNANLADRQFSDLSFPKKSGTNHRPEGTRGRYVGLPSKRSSVLVFDSWSPVPFLMINLNFGWHCSWKVGKKWLALSTKSFRFVHQLSRIVTRRYAGPPFCFATAAETSYSGLANGSFDDKIWALSSRQQLFSTRWDGNFQKNRQGLSIPSHDANLDVALEQPKRVHDKLGHLGMEKKNSVFKQYLEENYSQ